MDTNIRIINVWDDPGGIDEGIIYIHGIWGRKENYEFYRDAILHSCRNQSSHFPGQNQQDNPTHPKPEGLLKLGLPRFYLLLDQEEIIGCYALLTNDLISRQDLYPWLGCLYVDEKHRGRQLGSKLLAHGCQEARRLGFPKIYLTTDHDGYYERYSWIRMEDGFNLFGEQGRIYFHTLTVTELHN